MTRHGAGPAPNGAGPVGRPGAGQSVDAAEAMAEAKVETSV
ncbi:hypothetical protein SUDANB51_05807 [Streptomyces sp. enrichment culture]